MAEKERVENELLQDAKELSLSQPIYTFEMHLDEKSRSILNGILYSYNMGNMRIYAKGVHGDGSDGKLLRLSIYNESNEDGGASTKDFLVEMTVKGFDNENFERLVDRKLVSYIINHDNDTLYFHIFLRKEDIRLKLNNNSIMSLERTEGSEERELKEYIKKLLSELPFGYFEIKEKNREKLERLKKAHEEARTYAALEKLDKITLLIKFFEKREGGRRKEIERSAIDIDEKIALISELYNRKLIKFNMEFKGDTIMLYLYLDFSKIDIEFNRDTSYIM